MKRSLSLRTALVLMMISLLGGMGIHQVISADSIYQQLNKFKDILLISEKYYVDEVPTDKLVESAITGMVRELDPHSVYFPARSFEKVTEEMSGKFQGVGLQIRPLNDTIIVVEPIGGGPAARLGILSNDRIIRVNDSSIVGMSSADAAKRLRGPKGTKVRVEIVRAGQQRPLVYEVIRDDIALYSVDAAVMMEEDVGYINVNRFNTQTIHELES
ncbi:MAG: PDZ domain-containing protein, partial [Ignavibacteria bacterium]|nr:PDZ domain-containing protein [Ignavibacteria bacterium]